MIKANNLTKNYQVGGEQITALNEVSLKIDEGDFLVVTGPSGSGKSTLLYTLGGLLTPNVGYVHVDDLNIYGLNQGQRARFRRDNIGFIFQTFELLPYLTAIENVMIPLALNGVDSSNQLELGTESLRKVGLGRRLHHKPSELSGGEQQRVAIARGLVNKPRLLLADEPTGNLDTRAGRKIVDILERINKEGKTVVIVTHDHSIAKRTRRVLNISDGEIEEKYAS